MKKELEKLLVYLIPAILISKIVYASKGYLFGDLFSKDPQVMLSAMSAFPGYTPGQLITFVNFTSALISLIPTLVILVWLYKFEKKSGRPILWALGAFFMHYWILVLYIGQRILSKENQSA